MGEKFRIVPEFRILGLTFYQTSPKSLIQVWRKFVIIFLFMFISIKLLFWMLKRTDSLRRFFLVLTIHVMVDKLEN